MTVRLIRGLSQALHLTRSSTLIHDPGLNQLLLDCCQRVGVRTSIRLQESSLVDTPLLIGIWRPTILVPFKIQEHLSLAELESVLIHELHHVRRRDAAVSLLQAVLKAVYFFHPGVWVADRWLRRLREEACDEATVGVLDGNRRNYSSAILKLAEQTLRPAPPLAIGVVDSGSHITHRMRRILDPKLPTGQKLSWSALAFVLIAAATLLPAGPQQKVSAQKPEPQATVRGVVVDADEKPAAPVPAKPGQGAATGRVLRADTKQPIAEVEVRLVKKPDDYWVYPLEPKRVKSNAAGEYRFEDLPPGEYRVYAFHDRLASRTQQVRFDKVTIDSEGTSSPVDLFMADGLNMKVRVISKTTGEPIPNAAVRLRWTDNDDNAQTDEQGEVLISCLTRGEQHVEATAAGYSQAYLRQQLKSPMTEITLELPPGETMQGRVTDDAGNPIAGVEVSATPNRGMTNFDEATTDDQGRFTLQHLPLTDEFHVSASKKDWDHDFEPLSLQGGVPQSFKIRIRPRPSGGDVNVLIVDQAGKPIVGAEVSNHGNSSAQVLREKSDDAGRLTLRHLYLRSRSQPELVVRAAGFAPTIGGCAVRQA